MLSHATRAYIWNADGLKGFVKTLDIIAVLSEADKYLEPESVLRWLEFDLEEIQKEIEGIKTFAE